MNIFGIIALGIIGAILSVTVRAYRPEYGIVLGIICSAVIMFFMVGAIREVLENLERIVKDTGIDISYFKIIIKVTGIAYLTQFGAQTARDAGEAAIAQKVDSAGKIAVMLMTIPVISGFLAVLSEMLNKL